jgi:hypothetical protein
MGGKEVLPQMVCPCTNAYFAIWTDAFGNQILIKEPVFEVQDEIGRRVLESLQIRLKKAAPKSRDRYMQRSRRVRSIHDRASRKLLRPARNPPQRG